MQLPHIQQSAHIAYFFPHKLAFRRQFQHSSWLHYLFLLRFVTSTRFLPTEWHHQCICSPMDWDRVVVFKQFSTIFPHISVTYLVAMRSAYFLKMLHKNGMPRYSVTWLVCNGIIRHITYRIKNWRIFSVLWHCWLENRNDYPAHDIPCIINLSR